MNCGGGVGGFIATRDEERYAREYPTLLVSDRADTIEPGERGFGMTLVRAVVVRLARAGQGLDGNSVYLWTIANAVYMALLGPQGFARHRRADPAAEPPRRARLGELAGRRGRASRRGFFKEFVVRFDGTGKTVAEINDGLRDARHLRRQRSLADFPALGQSALYCVTEVHSPERHRPPRRGAARGDRPMTPEQAAPLPRRRLGRAARDGARLARPSRRRLPAAEPAVAEAAGDVASLVPRRCAARRRRRCPSCPSSRCSAITCTSRR